MGDVERFGYDTWCEQTGRKKMKMETGNGPTAPGIFRLLSLSGFNFRHDRLSGATTWATVERLVQGRNCRATCDVKVLINWGQKGSVLRVGHGQNKVHLTRQSVTAARQWRSVDWDTAGIFGTTGLMVTMELQRVRPEREAEILCLCNGLCRCFLSSSSRGFL